MFLVLFANISILTILCKFVIIYTDAFSILAQPVYPLLHSYFSWKEAIHGN